jgi:HlyD family secretion protein
MSLALAGPTQITAQVDERFLDQLQVGQKAMVVADAFADQRFAAHVLSIAPVIDPQRGAIEVKFALEETPPAFLREDMTLSVEVETGRRERALVLPLTALLGTASGGPANPQASVLVVQNGRVQERSVRLGLRTLDAVEILEGLAAGDVVLLQRTLQVGRRVRVQLVSWQPGAAAAPGSRAEDAGAAVMNAMGR